MLAQGPFYEMLTGAHPFRRGRPAETAAAVLSQDPAPYSASGGEVHPAVERVVGRMLADEREERYQSAHELRKVVEEVLVHPDQPILSVLRKIGRRTWPRAVLPAVLWVILGTLAYLAIQTLRSRPPAAQVQRELTQLTFTDGSRSETPSWFPDGQFIAYSEKHLQKEACKARDSLESRAPPAATSDSLQ